MTDDWKKTVHRNKLLGMWAAEKLGITGQDAEDYSDALAVGTLDQSVMSAFDPNAKSTLRICCVANTAQFE
jgi:hypothetical protein